MATKLSNSHFADAREEIIERIGALNFLCIYYNSESLMSASVIDFEYHPTGAYATAFFICPDCKNKFVVNIQDLGKVRN